MSVPRVLTIATSDSGGGAGIQADLKAFAAAGCHGMSALVALTAQNTTAVTAVHELPPDFIRAQLDAVFDDIGVDAAKTGMLFSRTIIETVAEFLERHPVPLVVDPVLIASSGAQLLQHDAVQTLIDRLFPLATVVTPNLPEAETLTGIQARPGASSRSASSSSAPARLWSPAGTGRPPSTTSSTGRRTSSCRWSATTSRRRTVPAARIRRRSRLCSHAGSRSRTPREVQPRPPRRPSATASSRSGQAKARSTSST